MFTNFCQSVKEEVERSQHLHNDFGSIEEAFAVLAEECDEVQEEVFKNPKQRQATLLQEELTQVAAVCCKIASKYFLLEGWDFCRRLQTTTRSYLTSDHQALTILWRRFRPIQLRFLDYETPRLSVDPFIDLASHCCDWCLMLAYPRAAAEKDLANENKKHAHPLFGPD